MSTPHCPAIAADAPASTFRDGRFGAVALTAVFAGSTAPTPLYHVYQETLGLTPLTLTLVFSAYAVSLLATLLTLGSLADLIGRRPVVIASLLTSALTMLIFASANSLPALAAARLAQGVGNGIAMSAMGAVILDANPRRGPLINSVTPFIGMSLGALGSSALVAYAPSPTRLPYAVMMAVFLALAAAAMRLPAPIGPTRPSLAAFRPRVVIPPQARGVFGRISLANVAAWALGGYALSLMPSLLRIATGEDSPLLGGSIVAAFTLSGATAVVALRKSRSEQTMLAGEATLFAGVLSILTGVALASAPVLAFGAPVAGFGVGAVFFGGARLLLPRAGPHERAGLLAAFYVESYVAFGLPVVLVGFAAPTLGLAHATYGLGGALALLVAASFAVRRVSARRRVSQGSAR